MKNAYIYYIIAAVVAVTFWVVVGYVAIHFISKYW